MFLRMGGRCESFVVFFLFIICFLVLPFFSLLGGVLCLFSVCFVLLRFPFLSL